MSPSICRLAPSRSECGIAPWLALQGVRDRLTRRPIYQHTILFALITCCAVPPAAAGMRLAPNSKTLVTSLRRGGEIDLTDAQADLLNQMNRHDRASTHWRARPDDGARTHTEQTQSP